MLNSMRKHASGWVAKAFLAILVVSFAVWGIADIFRGFRGDTLASVGDTDISIRDFQRSYELQLQTLSRQLGKQVTAQQAQAIGVPAQVLGQLVAEASLKDQAEEFGLGMSAERLATEIAADPSFKNAAGAFDRARFQQVLQSNYMTEAGYVAERRQYELRQQIAAAVTGGLAAPETYGKAIAAYRGEQRSVAYLSLASPQAGEIAAPSDEELATYYDANKATWRAPETRSLAFLALRPENVARPADVTDAEVAKRYEQVRASLGTPETRRVRQIVFKDKAEAEAAVARLKGGETFDAVLGSMNLKPEDVDLGTVARSAIADAAVADAAFSLAKGQTSAVVDGRFGPVVVEVLDIVPAAEKTLAEVAGQMRADIARERAGDALLEMHDQIEDARAGGETLAEIAKKLNLVLATVTGVDREGKRPDGAAVADIPAAETLLAQAFESDIGIENDPVDLPGGGYVWFEVTEVKASADRPLAEVRGAVVDAWRRKQIAGKLEAKATDVSDKLKAGASIDTVAAELGVPVQTAGSLTRQSEPADMMSAAMIAAAFAGPTGEVSVAPGKEPGSQIVLKVTGSVVPAYSGGSIEDATALRGIQDAVSNDLLAQYIQLLQTNLGVRVNQAALQQVLGAPGS